MLTLQTPIEKIPAIRKDYIPALKRLGILCAKDIIFHFPFRHEDYSNTVQISDLRKDEVFTIQGEIIKCEAIRTWKKKMRLTTCTLGDETGNVRAVWFNQPFLAKNFTAGKTIRISGKVSLDKTGLYFTNPQWEAASKSATNTAGLVPIYPETEGLTSKWLRWQTKKILPLAKTIIDPIPTEILKKLNLPTLFTALSWIHFPKNNEQFILAQKRFAFEEMLLVQIASLQTRLSWSKEKAAKIKFNERLIKDFISSLSFSLTNAQKKSAYQIFLDMEKPNPMNRLLNGDVGSGKTLVAAMAALSTADAKFQVAILAPTEVLARQHYITFCKLMSGQEIKIGLLTNSYRVVNSNQQSVINKEVPSDELPSASYNKISRDEMITYIKSGNIDILIGTHAVIQKGVHFKNLALIIVDEQHRFGVSQRAYLQREIENINDGLKGKVPHLLSMTATPIPRTLTLSIFGDLDISVLNEMPVGRKEIITRIVTPSARNEMFDFVRSEISNGRQAFIIFPLVEESKALSEIKAATSEHKRLSEEIFPDLKLGLLHGRLKSKEKEEVMEDFKNKKYDILVATSVVEVGIDIANASIIIIEDADRFGLSQLHQFRGRVGRAQHQSYCLLFAKNSSSNKRLAAMEKYSSGFDIAEKDLEIRGPGQYFGTIQSGLPDIAMQNIANIKLIEVSRNEAQKILENDPDLKNNPPIRERIESFQKNVHLE